MYKIKSGEINIHCPFCGDALRTNAYTHGHLYLSIDSPVFHCFRCNSSGVLISFLLETDFKDIEIINDLKKYIQYRFTKNYFKSIEHINITKVYDKIKSLHYNFKKNNIEFYQYFIKYNKYRIGNILDIVQFLIFPDMVYDTLSNGFLNSNDNISCWRNITNSNPKYRYKLNKGPYYFQTKNFDKYRSIVIAEGPFDIINSYLYLYQFKDSFFMSINSLRYITETEALIIKHLMIGEFEINIIFDSSLNYKYIMYKISQLTYLNKNISFKFWTTDISKDIGEFPKIVELI
ncbi:MAG: hypothetical protein ACOC33_01935 [bacterium]